MQNIFPNIIQITTIRKIIFTMGKTHYLIRPKFFPKTFIPGFHFQTLKGRLFTIFTFYRFLGLTILGKFIRNRRFPTLVSFFHRILETPRVLTLLEKQFWLRFAPFDVLNRLVQGC